MTMQLEYPAFHVLWIEEEIDKYYPLEDDLKHLFHLDTAATEDTGLQYLEKNRYDLVLLDLMLPKNSEEHALEFVHLEAGQRILRKLRDPNKPEKWATPFDCRVIVWTARGKEEALSEVISLINKHGELIQKPVKTDDLVERIRQVLLNDMGTTS